VKIEFCTEPNTYRITLADPPLNILDIAMLEELRDALARVSPDRHVLIIDAKGEKAFSAGASVQDHVAETVAVMLHNFHHCFRMLARLDLVTVALVRGLALGGGCELAMACDLRVAGESAKFGQPEVKIGIVPGGGGTQRLTNAIGKYKAMRYILTGDLFGAKEAFDMGLVSELVPDAEVEKRAIAMAQQLAELSPLALQLAKESVLTSMEAPLSTGLAYETKCIQMLFSSQDQKEGMATFIEKRKPKFIGK